MLRIGHRGASAYAPENTLQSFRKAIELGADGIELDVHLCRSGELVVIHDDTVDRTTGGRGQVADMTLAQLQALPVVGGGRIPLLSEVFEALGPEAYYFIEIKHANAALQTAAMIEQYQGKGWQAERLMLISFLRAALAEAKEAFPFLRTGVGFEVLTPHSAQEVKQIGACTILPHFSLLDENHIKKIYAFGLKLFTWTVNTQTDIDHVRSLGVDGIMSDYPDRLVPHG